MNITSFKGKSVLVTGHTGFKGGWLCHMLKLAGANLTGYSLSPAKAPNLFQIARIAENMNSVIGDIRDYTHLKKTFDAACPEYVIHLAAQPLVREGYGNPAYTYETNVMGTVNVLECIRNSKSVISFLNVTTDKVYKNKEWIWGYRENEELDGFDPYSNSKSCSEMITETYKRSFFTDRKIAVSTARAGNVIGGGDFSRNRIIPDCINAAFEKRDIMIRNPESVRPYQHVIEPLMAYLNILWQQSLNCDLSGSYNIGPREQDCVRTEDLVRMFCSAWPDDQRYTLDVREGEPHEANYLRLDVSKIKAMLNIEPCWPVEMAVRKTVEWAVAFLKKDDILSCMDIQIAEYMERIGDK